MPGRVSVESRSHRIIEYPVGVYLTFRAVACVKILTHIFQVFYNNVTWKKTVDSLQEMVTLYGRLRPEVCHLINGMNTGISST